ncbi:conserved exported hypothetical protein [Vibrio chagasii]|nr:hypothetical protein AOG25_09950 [Vibrio alginolyticus]CAH7172453.1 conserved exported hypothetical protein [Vibrio chagasii]
MILDNLIKSCEFDFSKASRNLKTTILTLSTLMIATNSMSATAASPGDSFLDAEQSSYAQSMQSESHTGTLDTWNYMLNRTAPNDAGAQYLDSMENMGMVQTPITYSEYQKLANTADSSAKVDVFRNPLSKDGIVVMATSQTVKRNNIFESLFTSDKHDLSKHEGKATYGLIEEFNAWQDQKIDNETFKELRGEAIEKVNLVVGGLANDNMKEKFGVKARRGLTGGFENRSFEVIDAAIGGLKDGVARNPGGKFYFDDGNAKVNVSALYSGGSYSLQASMAIEAMRDTAELSTEISPQAKEFMTKDFFPIDRDLISELSQEEKIKISNTNVLIHEVYHGVISYSTNSAQPSLMFNAFNQAYNSDTSGDLNSRLKIGKLNALNMGAYRLNHESTSDMAAMTVAASGADEASWEYAKLLQQSLRKQSYLTSSIIKPTDNPNYQIELSNIDLSKVDVDKDVLRNHDVSFLVNGWVLALEDARNGDDPNNLLSLASEPVKMGMAIQFANAVVLKELNQMTNNWESIPKEQYDDLIVKGSEIMQDYVKSNEFKSVMEAINTVEHEPQLGASNEMLAKFEEPKTLSKLKI